MKKSDQWRILIWFVEWNWHWIIKGTRWIIQNSWIMVSFFHRLMNSNRLAVLSQLSMSVCGAPQTVLPSPLTRTQFNGDSQYIQLMTIFYGGQRSILQMDLCWRGHVNLTMAGSIWSKIYITILFSLIWESYQQCQPYMIQKVKDGIRYLILRDFLFGQSVWWEYSISANYHFTPIQGKPDIIDDRIWD